MDRKVQWLEFNAGRTMLPPLAPRTSDAPPQRHGGETTPTASYNRSNGASTERVKISIMSTTVKKASHPLYKIASIPGDGIGPEVISAGITVLKKLASVLGTFDLQFDHFDWSSDYYKKHGRYIPEGGLDEIKKYDAIFFGSVGAPGTSPLSHKNNPSTTQPNH